MNLHRLVGLFLQRLVRLVLAMILVGVGTGVAAAQTLTLTPSLAISESYDDNIRFSSTNRQSDFVTGLSPGLRLELKDYPWSLALGGSLGGEVYAEHTELDNIGDNAEGSATAEYRPTPIFSLSLGDSIVRSVNAGLVDPQSGLITGRFTSTSNAVTPAANYQFNPRTSGRVQYSFRTLRSDSALARDSDTHEAGLSFQRQLTPRTSGTLSYTFTRFQIEGSPERDSHSPRIGTIFTYSPTIRFSSDTGLLFLEREDGSEEATVATSTRYEQTFRQGQFSLSYDRNASVAGVIGVPSVSQTLGAAVTYQPARDLGLGLQVGVTDTESSGPSRTRVDFLASSAALRINYRLLRWLSIEGSYRYQRQDDRRGPLDLERNVFSLGLTASDQFRVH